MSPILLQSASNRRQALQHSFLKSFGPFVVSFNFIGSDALQELVITPALSPTIPDTKTNFKSCNTAIQSDASHSTIRCQILCGCRLAYKLLINPAWSMYFSIHTLCSLRRTGGMLNLFYFETIVHAVGKILDIIVRKCIGECLKNAVAYIFKILFSEKPRGIDLVMS
jgi:hypothetical protein